MEPRSRRCFLQASVGAGAFLAGCAGFVGGETNPRADVAAGPSGRLTFEPDEITVSTGETVSWFFASETHNLSCRPSDSELVSLPADAESFATYEPDESPRTLVPSGVTYSHTFTVPGTYVYVCIPHESAGMIGRVHVE